METVCSSPDWLDITSLCREASAQLDNKRPMINIPNFSLFEAMSALELMDPNMDQLMNLKPPLNADNLFDISFPSQISDDTLMRLFQTLICQEVMFLEGASLCESTHSCILLWQEAWERLAELSPQSQLIVEYAKQMHVCMGNINQSVLNADIYEEEDFQPLASPSLSSTIPLATMSDFSFSLSSPLKLLLSFRSNWLACTESVTALIEFCQRLSNHTNPANSASVVELGSKCKHNFDTLSELINDICRNISEGALLGTVTGQAEEEELLFAFNSVLTKRLQLNPQRKVAFRSFAESINTLKLICNEMSAVFAFLDMISVQPEIHFEELLAICLSLSTKRQHVIVRSMYVSIIRYYSSDMNVLILRSLSLRGFPAELLSFPLLIEKWMPTLAKVCWGSIKMMFSHRNKLLNRLEIVLGDWATVCNDAPFVDHQYHSEKGKSASKELLPWFRYWTLCVVTQIIDVFMGLLMEMELIAVPEMDYFYWYWDYICNTRCWVLEKFRTIQYELAKNEYDEEVRKRKLHDNPKLKKKGPKLPPLREPPTPLVASADELCMKAKSQLCRGLCRMMLAANAVGVSSVAKQKYEHSDWHLIFHKRFGALAALANPPFLSYDEFLETIKTRDNIGDNSSVLVDEANVSFNNVKKYMDFVRKNVADGSKATIFSDQNISPTNEAAAVALPVVVASSAADKIAKSYCIATLKIAVANSLGAVKTVALLKKSGTNSTAPVSFALSVDRSHDCHFPAVEIKVHT